MVQQQAAVPDDHPSAVAAGRPCSAPRHLVLGRPDLHLGPTREQLVHHTLEVRGEMLQNDKRHSGVGGEVREQALE
jgi:hypothetical protein